MIPRFIVKDTANNQRIIDQLKALGYEATEGLYGNIQAIGKSLMVAERLDKNHLYKIYSADDPALLEQAKLQAQWNQSGKMSPIQVGDKKLTIHVNEIGIIMDYCLVAIEEIKALRDSLNIITNKPLVTHAPVINPKAYFLTIGCCDFSVNDFNNIMKAHQELSETP